MAPFPGLEECLELSPTISSEKASADHVIEESLSSDKENNVGQPEDREEVIEQTVLVQKVFTDKVKGNTGEDDTVLSPMGSILVRDSVKFPINAEEKDKISVEMESMQDKEGIAELFMCPLTLCKEKVEENSEVSAHEPNDKDKIEIPARDIEPSPSDEAQIKMSVRDIGVAIQEDGENDTECIMRDPAISSDRMDDNSEVPELLVSDNENGSHSLCVIEVESLQDGGSVTERIVCIPVKSNDIVEGDVDSLPPEKGQASVLEGLSSFLEDNIGGCECQSFESGSEKARSVNFSSLNIREFHVTLGDHPSVGSGPPVMLDWNSKSSERVVGLDEYERARCPRRHRKEMRLSKKERKHILLHDRGLPEEVVNQAWAEAIEIRKQRRETINRGYLLMVFDDVYESACRKYNRFLDFLRLSLCGF